MVLATIKRYTEDEKRHIQTQYGITCMALQIIKIHGTFHVYELGSHRLFFTSYFSSLEHWTLHCLIVGYSSQLTIYCCCSAEKLFAFALQLMASSDCDRRLIYSSAAVRHDKLESEHMITNEEKNESKMAF